MMFEAGFKVADGVFSVNIVWVNMSPEELAESETTALEEAETAAHMHAERHGYEVAYLHKIDVTMAAEMLRKGMPMYYIDDESVRRMTLASLEA